MKKNKLYFIKLTEKVELPPITIDFEELRHCVLEANKIDISKEECDTMAKLVKAINATDDWFAELVGE